MIKIRQRARDETDNKNNALKRALCLIELHLFGIEGGLLSQEDMNEAVYCSDTPAYDAIRNRPSLKQVDPPSMTSRQQEGHLNRIHEGLELGQKLVLGAYEFTASRQFSD